MKQIFRILVLLFVLLTVNFTEALAIDTSNWERTYLHLLSAKPEKEFLIDLAFWSVIRGIPNSKTKGHYDSNKLIKYLNSNGDIIKIPIKPAFNDITYFSAKYSLTKDKPLYVIIYEFKEHSFPVIDVLGRYGYEFVAVSTDKNLVKEYKYTIRNNMYDKLHSIKHPLEDWALINETGQVMFHFTSEDGVFINSLLILFQN